MFCAVFSDATEKIESLSPVLGSTRRLTGRFCARENLYAIDVVEGVVHLTDKLKKDNFATNSHVQII